MEVEDPKEVLNKLRFQLISSLGKELGARFFLKFILGKKKKVKRELKKLLAVNYDS